MRIIEFFLDLWECITDHLLELLIVVAILGIVASIAIPAIVRDRKAAEKIVVDESLPFYITKYRVEGGWLYRDGSTSLAFVPDKNPCQVEATR